MHGEQSGREKAKILRMDQLLLECSDEVSKLRQLSVGVDNCALEFEC